MRRLRAWSICLLSVGFLHAASHAPLVEAAATEDLTEVRALLASGADANQHSGDGTTALHWMVRAQNPEMVDLLLASGADPNVVSLNNVSPLYLAASLPDISMMDRLLAAGADPNVSGPGSESLLMVATHQGATKGVASLLAHGADPNAAMPESNTTPLMVAIRDGQPDIVRLLIDAGAGVNTTTLKGEKPPRRPAGAGGGSHGVGIIRGGLPETGSQTPTTGLMSPLMYAARDGQLEMARMLVEAGADIEQVEANNITPLQMAITNDNVAVAEYLLEQGANVNSADDYGRTPLWFATEMRDLELPRGSDSNAPNGIDRPAVLELIKKLIDAGADVNARTTDVPPARRYLMGLGDLSWVNFIGQTPFLRASISGDLELMHLLLDHGADPNIETEEGTTALMAAAGVNWVVAQTFTEGPEELLEAVKLCLSLGADVNHANSMGLTAVHGAANRGSDDIIRFLYEHGARLDVPDKEGRTPYVWAQGVFLATNAPVEKPGTMALIQELLGEAPAPAETASASLPE